MIYNQDCIMGAMEHFSDESVDLMICDPPFGIAEASFDKHYSRKNDCVITGYREAPDDYFKFSLEWIAEAKRIMKPNASMYIFSGWTKLHDILNAVNQLKLTIVNHIIWKYNFGVYTRNKFVSSHYHILYITKQGARPTFNTYCRFGPTEKNDGGGSLNYKDLEDVFIINKEFKPKTKKNQNKLPDEIVEKLILYSSNQDDIVCDFFQGNFTTALNAKSLGRKAYGFELNQTSFELGIAELAKIDYGCRLAGLKKVDVKLPENQGKPISTIESATIYDEFNKLMATIKSKRKVIDIISEKFGRGFFSITNIIEHHKKQNG